MRLRIGYPEIRLRRVFFFEDGSHLRNNGRCSQREPVLPVPVHVLFVDYGIRSLCAHVGQYPEQILVAFYYFFHVVLINLTGKSQLLLSGGRVSLGRDSGL